MMDVNMWHPECENCLYWSHDYGTCDKEEVCNLYPEDERIEEDKEEEQ